MVGSRLVLVLQAVFAAHLGLRAIPEDQELDFDELSDDELLAWAGMVRRLLLCGLIPRELRQRARHELRSARMEHDSREDEYERRTLREVHATRGRGRRSHLPRAAALGGSLPGRGHDLRHVVGASAAAGA